MKKIKRELVAMCAVVLFSSTGLVDHAFAQDSVKIIKKEVPDSVLKAFSQAYPKATISTYSREQRDGKTCYELESKDGATKRDIIYAADGAVMEIEEAMKPSELPLTVMTTLTKNYPNAKIIAAEKLTKATVVQYEATIIELAMKTGGKKIDLLFSDAGELVKSAIK